MDKKRTAIIGVTGSVGQEFVQSLENHPWFEVTQIAASERSAGKKYLDAIRNPSGIVAWDVEGEIPEYIKEMTVKRIEAGTSHWPGSSKSGAKVPLNWVKTANRIAETPTPSRSPTMPPKMIFDGVFLSCLSAKIEIAPTAIPATRPAMFFDDRKYPTPPQAAT